MHDRDVRKAARDWLHALHAGDDDTRVVEEMGIWSGSVRIDIAVINGELHGIELKSAKDTLSRLPLQAELYNEVFDKVTLIIAEKHVPKAVCIIPSWWGVSTAHVDENGQTYLVETRRPASNPQQVPVQIARLLWRDEAISVLKKHDLDKGFKSKTTDVIAGRLASALPLDVLREEVRKSIKGRHDWLG